MDRVDILTVSDFIDILAMRNPEFSSIGLKGSVIYFDTKMTGRTYGTVI